MLNLKLLSHLQSIKITILITCFLCSTSFMFAQEINNFKGIYILNDSIEGVADLNYFLKNRDTILDGNFEFKSINEKAQDEYTTYEYTGKFDENKKNDDWYFKSKSLSLDKDYSIKDLLLQSTTTGVSNEVFANFKNGKANDKWTSIKYKFENSIPSDTLYNITTHFDSGILEGNFLSSSKNLKVSGQFSEGFMHGVWIFDFCLFFQLNLQ